MLTTLHDPNVFWWMSFSFFLPICLFLHRMQINCHEGAECTIDFPLNMREQCLTYCSWKEYDGSRVLSKHDYIFTTGKWYTSWEKALGESHILWPKRNLILKFPSKTFFIHLFLLHYCLLQPVKAYSSVPPWRTGRSPWGANVGCKEREGSSCILYGSFGLVVHKWWRWGSCWSTP